MSGFFSTISRGLSVDPDHAKSISNDAIDASDTIREALEVIGLLQTIAFDEETEMPATARVAHKIGWVISNLADLQGALEHIRFKAQEVCNDGQND